MPGVKIHEAGHEVETEGGGQGDDDDAGTLGGEERHEESIEALVELDLLVLFPGEGADYQEEREDYQVELDYGEDYERRYVGVSGANRFYGQTCSS